MWRTIKAYLYYTWGGLHRYFGNQNSMLREHERAVHYFSRAFDLNPTMTSARLARAVILWRELGCLDEALLDFNAILAEDPNHGAALLNRALIYQQTGDFERALVDIQHYLSLSPDPQYHDLAERLASLLQEVAGTNKPAP